MVTSQDISQAQARNRNKNLTIPDGYMTRAAAADILGVNMRTLDRYINQGKLTKYRVGEDGYYVVLSIAEVNAFYDRSISIIPAQLVDMEIK